MEIKVIISVDLMSIKTGHIINSEKAKPFDFNDEKQLKRTLAEIFHSIKGIQLAEADIMRDNPQWRGK